MVKGYSTIIRPFDGSLHDAEGILAVERATFDESPYSPEQIQPMLSEGPQRAWVALAGGRIVGFVVTFLTRGWQGPCWEIDLLAVHPDWQGHGLATRLIRVAGARGARFVRHARAAVATDNEPSLRAFARAGFRREAEPHELWIYRPEEAAAPNGRVDGIRVREVDYPSGTEWPGSLAGESGSLVLLAEPDHGSGNKPLGTAELLYIETLLYRGAWIESLQGASRRVRQALALRAVARVREANLDELGAMVPEQDPVLRDILAESGFRSLGDFYWLRAELPLPGYA
jgi:ribosomal protein S18 acetylase RimI-like enzyme